MNLQKLKYTAFVQMYGLFKIPLLLFISPRVQEFDESSCEIKIPLGYRTKNHLNSMYFGALAVGAELSIAAAAVFAIHESKERVDFVFKDFRMQFLKRADGDTCFVCEDVAGVRELIARSLQSEERLEKSFKGFAYVEGRRGEPVAEYELVLSVRHRRRGK